MDKKKYQNLFNHPFLAIIFTCFCIFAIFSLQLSSKKAFISKESIEQLEKNVEILEKEVNRENEKLKISQEPIALEKILRNELLLKKDGEIVLQIPEKEASNNHNEDLDIQLGGPLKEWQKLFFFQKNY